MVESALWAWAMAALLGAEGTSAEVALEAPPEPKRERLGLEVPVVGFEGLEEGIVN